MLTSAHLLLRPIDPARDAAAFFALNQDPEVIRYTGDGAFASVEATEAFFRERVALYAREGMGRWLVERVADGETLGWCGLRRLDGEPEFAGEVDLGYRFFRQHWGQGYATEASRACLAHGFGALGLPRILARIDPANAASRAVAVKLGMRLQTASRPCGHLAAALIYELTAAEWPSESAM